MRVKITILERKMNEHGAHVIAGETYKIVHIVHQRGRTTGAVLRRHAEQLLRCKLK